VSGSNPTPSPEVAVAPRLLATFEDGLRIGTFDTAHRQAFKRLNLAWLTRYLEVEPLDERVLGDPESEILAGGGEILFAVLEDEIVGTVALKAEASGDFELTKMAVDDRYQGRGYGKRLLEAACALAQQRGAREVILYSHGALRAAVSMYVKYGFVELPLNDARYTRCDIKMRRTL
jgi:GNAT superfamily N-acetyltransferase